MCEVRGVHLGAFGRPLGRLWGAFGVHKGRLGVHLRPLGSQNGTQTIPQIDPNMHFGIASTFSMNLLICWLPSRRHRIPCFVKKLQGFIAFKRRRPFRVEVRFGFALRPPNGAF